MQAARITEGISRCWDPAEHQRRSAANGSAFAPRNRQLRGSYPDYAYKSGTEPTIRARAVDWDGCHQRFEATSGPSERVESGQPAGPLLFWRAIQASRLLECQASARAPPRYSRSDR